MFAHDQDFVRGTAMVLQGESLKARAYVTHAGALGSLREKMVLRFVSDATPDRFKVETGLIRNHDTRLTSKQCDLLIHETTMQPPMYRWDDFAVVDVAVARAVVEVKSKLKKETFGEIVQLQASVEKVWDHICVAHIPVLGYALSGVKFDTFISYVASAVSGNAMKLDDQDRVANVPPCIVVQGEHYIGLRPMGCAFRTTPRHYCAVNLNKADKTKIPNPDGIETGIFLQVYAALLGKRHEALSAEALYASFNRLPVDADGKLWIEADGTKHTGNIR